MKGCLPKGQDRWGRTRDAPLWYLGSALCLSSKPGVRSNGAKWSTSVLPAGWAGLIFGALQGKLAVGTQERTVSVLLCVRGTARVRERTFAYVLVNLLSARPVAVTHFARSPLISHPSPSSFSFCSPSPHPSTHIRQHLRKEKKKVSVVEIMVQWPASKITTWCTTTTLSHLESKCPRTMA